MRSKQPIAPIFNLINGQLTGMLEVVFENEGYRLLLLTSIGRVRMTGEMGGRRWIIKDSLIKTITPGRPRVTEPDIYASPFPFERSLQQIGVESRLLEIPPFVPHPT